MTRCRFALCLRLFGLGLLGVAAATVWSCATPHSPAVSSPSPPPAAGSTPYFLLLSDIHLNDQRTQSAYGRHHDTGTDLWTSLQHEIARILSSTNPPGFVLYLGDLPAHTDADPTPDIPDDIGEVLAGLRAVVEAAPKPIPLLYLPGNNDSLDGDYCQFSDSRRDPEPPYTRDAGHARDWPLIHGPPCTRVGTASDACLLDPTHRLDGYYSAYPTRDRRLRVLALNTVMFNNSGYCSSWTDRAELGDQQLAWLEQQLGSASANDEKVIVAMHIPPGTSAYCDSSGSLVDKPMWDQVDQQNTFLEHIDRYRDTIVGVFTSHTHMDEIRILHGPRGPAELAISAPGISPNHGQNPSFKFVQYDPSSWQIIGATTRHVDRLPVSDPQDPSVWEHTYTFRDSYSCTATDTTLWDCAGRQSTDALYRGLEQTLFVKKTTPTCDVRVLLDVEYTGQR
ncbi:MAG: metallophosphoesterase [Acidobacteriota bacterium]